MTSDSIGTHYRFWLEKPTHPVLKARNDRTCDEKRGRETEEHALLPRPPCGSCREEHRTREGRQQNAAEEFSGISLKWCIDTDHRNSEKHDACDRPRHHRKCRAIVRSIND